MVLLTTPTTPESFQAPDFDLKSCEDLQMTLADYAHTRVLVIVFMCNHCPYVQAILPRLNAFADSYDEDEVMVVGINSNDSKQYPEDGFAHMKTLPVAFDYLHDATQEVAKAYGAVCTPDFFVFNQDRELRYRGQFDDNWQDESTVTKHSLRDAVTTVMNDNPDHMLPSTPSQGCSIKWCTP